MSSGLISAKYPPWLKPLYLHHWWKEACISIVWLKLLPQLFTRSLTITMEFSNLWNHCYRFTHAFLHTVQNYVPFRYQQPLFR